MIELKNIYFSYGDLQILNNFSLTINDGEVVQLFGESGSGKTTVARIVLGLENIDSGNIVVPQKISVVFQEDRLLENFDIQKNVRLVLTKEQYTFADSLLKEFGLYDIRKKKVSELSGGMKRRVALIRAIAYGGDALVLDEPFNGLDLENKRVASAIIKREYTDKNKPVLLISHIEEDGKLLNSNKISI